MFDLIIGIILLVFSVFLVIAVLMQEGKSHNLSGTIAGGADTFFGKNKGQAVSKKLSVLTSVVAIIFVLLVCTVYVRNAENKTDNESFWEMVVGSGDEDKTEDTTAAQDTTAAAAEETTAAEAEDTTAEQAEDTTAETAE
ncbi:MAG: preprotein translocase subunit SecG [Clostridia bacterium]|nr:preprotein translocase subunit SecG [Clostridia bacterium]